MKKQALCFLVIIMSSGCDSTCGNLTGVSARAATKEAKFWAQQTGIEVDHVVCNGTDSDNDGYVSCAFNRGGVVTQYECASVFNFNSGCRVPKPQFRGTP